MVERWGDQPAYLDSHDSAQAHLASCAPTDLLDAATRHAHTNHVPWFGAERERDTLRGMVDQDGVRFLERERYILTLHRRWRILRAGQRRLKTEWACWGFLAGLMCMEVVRWLVAP